MTRYIALPVPFLLLLPLVFLLLLGAADEGAAQSGTPDEEALIANALSAAPPSLAANAAVTLPSGETLREGSNGYVCMPDDPDVPNNTPMCLDQPWHEMIDAWMGRREPHVSEIGIGYMLQEDLPTSNVDPFATAPSADNEWLQEGPPHVMIVTPDPALLEGLTTDPHNGGPWVMWKGTPYAHLMVPAVPRSPEVVNH